MKKEITKKEFQLAENRMNELLAAATRKGGFDILTKKETAELNEFTEIVKIYEDANSEMILNKQVPND